MPPKKKSNAQNVDSKALFEKLKSQYSTTSKPSNKTSTTEIPNDEEPKKEKKTGKVQLQPVKEEEESLTPLESQFLQEMTSLNAKINKEFQNFQRTSAKTDVSVFLDSTSLKRLKKFVKETNVNPVEIPITKQIASSLYISLEVLGKLGIPNDVAVKALQHHSTSCMETILDWICLYASHLPEPYSVPLERVKKIQQGGGNSILSTIQSTSPAPPSCDSSSDSDSDDPDVLSFETLEINALKNPVKNKVKKAISLSIPTSWTGKTPVNLLNTYYQNFTFDVSDFKATLKIKNGPIVTIDDFIIDALPKQKGTMTKHLVATKLLYLHHPQSYHLLPPAFRDVWSEWDKEKERHERDRLVMLIRSRIKDIEVICKNVYLPKEDLEEDVEFQGRKPRIPPSVKQLSSEWKRRITSPNYEKMESERTSLPIYQVRHEFYDILNQEWDFLIIEAETGSGKSTLLPFLLLSHIFSTEKPKDFNVFITQPRRISTVSIASRVGQLINDSHHSWIGYQIRGEDTTKPSTCITFMTLGILLNHFSNNPELNNVTHLIIDEVHEDSIELNVVLRHLYFIKSKRPDLKVILMSATMDPLLSRSLQGYRLKEWKVFGKMYPVQTYYLEDAIRETGLEYSLPESLGEKIIPYEIIQTLLSTHDGTSLVFLPGIAELNKCKTILEKHTTLPIILLHSTILPSPLIFTSKPKIILATNIAETGITVPNLDYVIDSCLVKRMKYDDETMMERLRLEWTSQSSSIQRRGRAGRTKSGKCHHLLPFHLSQKRNVTEENVLMRESLISSTLWIISMNYSPHEFWSNPLLEKRITTSLNVLHRTEALKNGKLTNLGRLMTNIPLSPPFAKMVLWSIPLKCFDVVLNVVSMLSIGLDWNVTTSEFIVPDSDLLTLHNLFEAYEIVRKDGNDKILKQWCLDRNVDGGNLHQVHHFKKSLVRSLQPFLRDHVHPNEHCTDRKIIDFCFGIGLYPRIISCTTTGFKSSTCQEKIMTSNTSQLKDYTTQQLKLFYYFEKRVTNSGLSYVNGLHCFDSLILFLLERPQLTHLNKMASFKNTKLNVNVTSVSSMLLYNLGIGIKHACMNVLLKKEDGEMERLLKTLSTL